MARARCGRAERDEDAVYDYRREQQRDDTRPGEPQQVLETQLFFARAVLRHLHDRPFELPVDFELARS